MSDFAIDIFNDDAFSMTSLTAGINNLDHVPGRAGDLAFTGVGEGVATNTVVIESIDMQLSLIPTTLRGAPAPYETRDRRKAIQLAVPHIKLEDTVQADSVQNVRDFASGELVGAEAVINRQMQRMALRHDLTIENHRLGALRGVIHDADGSVLLDLFAEFGISNSLGQAAPETFEFPLDDYSGVGITNSIRTKCQAIQRFMRRNAKTVIPKTAQVWAFCGDNFFDKLLEHPSVKGVYDGYAAAKQALGDNYAFGIFEFGGIMWENYQGTDDGETVAIGPDEARFFFTGVPGLYAEYFAPGDFMETVNTLGLPRYAKLAPDKFNRYVELHTQQNPLPLCLRPQTLVRGVAEEASE
ncbi:major capsid protein [Afipia felis]|uniref:Phage major capsid protein E n=2 Tax=Afipia felis TaxID=1035 RepID=A0A380WB64_AFIFE|nr:major capsid protein [Afipia felis]EKS29379.1 hypothetical protein HMPREF9697_01907 [Afipia felis ATCC 53690]SUU78087.1 Uncharacterised protein [Afipia felis]SUU86152.1 Uncharacterised protein [Afipia felis]